MKLSPKLILTAIAAILSMLVLALFLNLKTSSNTPTVNVSYDKTVIVDKIQGVNKLETTQMVIQRDIALTLDLGNVEVFGKNIERTRTQNIAITGTVAAGVDLSKLNADNVELKDNTLAITLPAPEIFNINIDEDKSRTLSDDLTLLFRLDTLTSGNKQTLNEQLQDQASKQAKEALKKGACEAQILDKANVEAEKSVKNLFLFGNLKEVTIKTTPASCSL
jgi:hypothetical protein